MGKDTVLFERVDYTITKILHFIDISYVSLPDIRRPLLWSPNQVRDLVDSIYQGFPIGYLLFWSHPSAAYAEQIGQDGQVHRVPSLLVVDGQQRLTSLYMLFRGGGKVQRDRSERSLKIAFRPRDSRFEVCDAIICRDPEFIQDISALWSSGKSFEEHIHAFLCRLREKKSLTDAEMERMKVNLKRLMDIGAYPLTALQIFPTVHELQVADIVVRVNKEGVELSESDLVMTLLSVFGEDVRDSLENFCWNFQTNRLEEDSPLPSTIFLPDPDQLLRCAATLAFHRADRHALFHVLRGIDLNTEEYSEIKSAQQFDQLRETTSQTLSQENWHGFFRVLSKAGFLCKEMFVSPESIIFTYVYYLMGKIRYGLNEGDLDGLIGRLYYATILTGRYTGPFEKELNEQLRLIKDLPNGILYCAALQQIIREILSPDLWIIRVPTELETPNMNSPVVLAYLAAQVLLDAPILFSTRRIRDVFTSSRSPNGEQKLHDHLFPPSLLSETEGITDPRLINQAANLCVMEWPAHIIRQGRSPSEYVPELQAMFGESLWEEMSQLHALPKSWHTMSYMTFLFERRNLMAQLIRRAMNSME